MTKECPNDEWSRPARFGIRASSLLRHSSFVLRHSYDESVAQLDNPIPVSRVYIRVRDLNDRRPLLVQALEHLHDFLALVRMQVAGRLVGQDQLRVRNHRARDADELLLAAG